MTRLGDRDDRHAAAWDQLAWYANGSLRGDERRRVEEHLERCAECRRELEFLNGLRSSLADDEALLLAPERGLARVSSRIDALEAAGRGWLGWGDLGRLLRAKLLAGGTRGRAWRPALAGALLVAAIASGWFLVYPAGNEFRTLSSAEAPPPAAAPTVRVVFAGRATADEIQRLLDEAGAQIISGPSEYGVYTVRLDPGTNRDGIAAVVDTLRASPRVRFAEPVPPPAGREGGR